MIGDSVGDRLKQMADEGDEIAIQKLSCCPKCSVQYAEMKDRITLCSVCEKQEAEDEMPEYQPVDLTKYVVNGKSEVLCVYCMDDPERKRTCVMQGCARKYKPDWMLGQSPDVADALALTFAIKHDKDKIFGYELIPFESLEEMAKLYEFGAKKYSPNNWRNGNGLGYIRCFNAMFRHLVAWVSGADLDGETRLHPLASVAFYCLAVIYYEKAGRKTDDRYKGLTK